MSKRIDAIGEASRSPRRQRLARRFLTAEDGAVAVIAAVAFPVLVGAMGLGGRDGVLVSGKA
ncbi:hypothetical protein Q1M64_03940 (plasmid) [Sinorhizobium meliloti]|nr:hypothetical protein Q1M64_03940 [Sinorhizobium meliloti]